MWGFNFLYSFCSGVILVIVVLSLILRWYFDKKDRKDK